ncbi:hypothetical protein [Chitinophaga sp. sic0106]|uniref:hypothetical protein n=1 Tax=Chitinophaga sp. sic0106 TaxID=2854785 RepID=UPI001C47B0B5|nr:hypothetical protein [Chitinophaga sp. sic0106]MBV7530714.1 hypothetical protein [Chitinophaga sp. sic0106]
MKKVVLSLAVLMAFAVACQNPQKHDEKKAEEKAGEAIESAEKAAAAQAASDANAVQAATAAVQANINAAMATVAMPEFKKANARSLANDFHKYLSDLVNTNSGKKAAEYADKLQDLKKEYDKKVDAEKLDPDDKAKLQKYVGDMLQAVQSANP